MSGQVAGTRLRCLAVWLGATAVLGALACLLLPDVVAAHHAVTGRGVTGQPFERLLEWSCAGVAAVGASWLWILTTLVTVEAARGEGRRPVRGVPAPLRRLVLAACGVALTGGLAAPALATPGEMHQDHAGAVSVSPVQGLPLPDRATGAVPGGGRMSRPGPAPSTPLMVVRVGDTLWDLAGESPAWHRIYELNRDVIGPDPDLIRPGQRLRLPRP
ncbi:LysM peptidoglycan-binding domain-containing protein [Nocardioides koreensis]|uniref:LysM peptidoglycan-binding domain-containing protein n=1 Tax=Nocardioides koreensis TaxID=433651 RepID=A0ABN2ZQS7_9ACTN